MKKLLAALLLICFSAVQVWADTMLGITTAEIANWASRAASGPYKSDGDVVANSPGDWDRIVANRNTFAANPSNGRWQPPVLTGGCVDDSIDTYGWPEANSEGGVPGNWSRMLRDAAFYNMVMGVTTDHAAIKAELLWVSSQTFTQWGNPTGIWCFGRLFDIAPSFGITSIMLRVLFAYDYIGRAAFTQPELDQLDRWFFDAADFWRGDMDNGMDGVFVDRWNGDYTRVEACETMNTAFVGAATIANYNAFNNNRRGNILRFSALTGIYLTRAGRNYTDGRMGTLAQIITSGKMFVQEFVRHGLFPQGFVGEFERSLDAPPESGWRYAGVTIGEAVDIAIAFARIGDTSLLEYNTALGVCGNNDGPINDGGSRVGENRDLLFAVQSYLKYMTDGYARYYPTNDSPTDNNRIDGRDPRDGSSEQACHETNMLHINLYFRETFIKQAYMRTHANSFPYTANINCGPPPWMGAGAAYPGTLFMFGQMEDNPANPFLGGEPPPPPSGSGQLELRVIRKLQ